MSPTKPLLLSTAFFLSACISLPAVDAPQAEVEIVAPSETAYTNSRLSFQLEVRGTPPNKVELLINDDVLTTLEPPYKFQWDTTVVAEGRYLITGRVHIAGETFTSEPVEVVVDRTPPQIVSKQPAPDAKEVGVRQPIQTGFSEAVSLQSITDESVRLTLGNMNIARALSLSTDGKTLTVIPSSSLPVPNTVSIALSDAVKDLAGNSLMGAPAIWQWTIPSLIPLGPPLSALPGSTDTHNPQLELDSAGNPVVAWNEHDGNGLNLYVSRWTGSQWQPLGGGLRVRTSPVEADRPVLQLDSTDTPLVAWHEGYGSNDDDHVYVSRWDNNQWVLLGGSSVNSDSPSAIGLDFRLDHSDRPVVATYLSAFNDAFLHRWNGAQWQPIGSGVGTNGADPSLVVFRNDYPLVIWIDRDGNNSVCLKQWSGTGWQPFGGASNPACPPVFGTGARPGSIRIQLNSRGSPVITWLDNDDSDLPLKLRTYKWTGQAWEPICGTPPMSTSATAAFSAAFLDLDSFDTPWLAWTISSANSEGFPHIWHCQDNIWASVLEDEFTDSFPPDTAYAGGFRTDAARNMTFAVVKPDGTANSIQVYTNNR